MIVHCTRCQHEWQAVVNDHPCRWCGAPGRPIASDYMSAIDTDPADPEPALKPPEMYLLVALVLILLALVLGLVAVVSTNRPPTPEEKPTSFLTT